MPDTRSRGAKFLDNFAFRWKRMRGGNRAGVEGAEGIDVEAQRFFSLRMSPIMRVSMTFDSEMDLDSFGIFNKDRFASFVRMQALSEQKRDGFMGRFVILDLVLLLFVFGKPLEIPGINISLSDIPAGLEIATVLSSIFFFLFALSFWTWHAYTAIVDQFGIRLGRYTGIDPDFITSSEKYSELWLKMVRKKFNIWGDDFFVAGSFYRRFFAVQEFFLVTLFLSALALHIYITWLSVRLTYQSIGLSVLFVLYAFFVLSANVCGTLASITSSYSFPFQHDFDARRSRLTTRIYREASAESFDAAEAEDTSA